MNLDDFASTKRALIQHPNPINREFSGVFEGGGAKGIAFAGALKALQRRRCWFSSVAGASAGAITAAFVAAGFQPNDIEGMTETALKKVTCPRRMGILLLSDGYGYFRIGRLKLWLRETLSIQMDALGAPNDDPSFLDLFNATGIELNVVATSLSMKSLVIFSHIDTPNCSVIDAVAASSSIPFAFEDSLLEVKVDGKVWHQTIVDGGVWNNFPWFIYTDRSFRKHYSREPIDSEDSIIGFLLDERHSFDDAVTELSDQPASQLLRNGYIKFSSPDDRKRLWEHRPTLGNPEHREKKKEPESWIVLQLSRLLALLGSMREDKEAKSVIPDRWPIPQSETARNFVGFLSGMVQNMSGIGGIIAMLFAASGTLYLFFDVTVLLYGWWADLPWISLWSIVKILSALFWGLALAAVLLTALMLPILFFTSMALNKTLRRVGYGLVTTYVEGSGASEWTSADPRVIRLPVAGIGTTEFELDPGTQSKLIESASRVTDQWLTSIGVPQYE